MSLPSYETPQAYDLTNHFYLVPRDAVRERESRWGIVRNRRPDDLPAGIQSGRLITAYLPFHRGAPAADEVMLKKIEIDSHSHEYEIARRIFQVIPELPSPPYMPVAIAEIKHVSVDPIGYLGRLGLEEILKRLRDERIIDDADGRNRYELVRGIGGRE